LFNFRDVPSNRHQGRQALLGRLALPKVQIPILGIFEACRAVSDDAPSADSSSFFDSHFELEKGSREKLIVDKG
jgi:hypothetical protein